MYPYQAAARSIPAAAGVAARATQRAIHSGLAFADIYIRVYPLEKKNLGI